MKRFLALLIIACIMLFSSVMASAEGAPKIYCDTIRCNSGETVSYSVHISDNIGMTAFLISIGCESDWLYFDETVVQGDFSDKGSMESSCDLRQLNVMWYDNDGVYDDGTLFTVDVHISPSAPSGDYPVEIAYSPENTLNAELDELELETSKGCITVTHIDAENIAEIVASNDKSNSAIGGNVKLIIGVSAAVAAAVVIIVIAKKRQQKTHD